MGNEMGNNNTSAIKEEDNASEADKNNLLEDTSEHANEISQEENNQNILTSSDITIENGKDISHENDISDDVKEKIQTISIGEANDAYEKATWFDSNNTTSILESDSLEEDTHESDINIENQIQPKAEDATNELGKVSLQEESRGDYANEKTRMIPTDEAKDVENDPLEGDTHESNINLENYMHSNDLLKGFGYDDKTSEVEDQPQKDKQDGNMIISFNNGIDVQGKTNILDSDDPLILGNSFGGEEEEMTGVIQPEKSPYVADAESVEDKNCKNLASSSLEGSEECEKQEDSCLRTNVSVTYNHYFNDESSIKQGFGNFSMGNEMGDNNTSLIKEKENTSEADKKNLLEDNSEHANEVSQDMYEDYVKEENHNIPTSLGKDVMEKASNISSDITIELGNYIPQENDHANEDDENVTIQTISIAEVNDADEKTTLFGFNNTTSMLKSDSLEEDNHASDMNMQNQMNPKAEKEDATTEPRIIFLQEESRGDDVKEKTQMIPTAETKYAEEKALGLILHNIERNLENDPLEGDTHDQKRDINMENQIHSIDESENVEEKAIGMAYDTRISLENDLLKGKDDHEIEAGFDSNDKTSELEVEHKPQEDKQDGNMIVPLTNGLDVQRKTIILASDDPLNLRNSFGGEGKEMTGVIQPEKCPYAESVEDENCESLTSSSLESSEECVKQEDSFLSTNLSGTYNHYLNDVSSIKQDEEETSVLTVKNALNTSNDSELQESPSVHHDEVIKFLSENSLQNNESLSRDTLPDADSHFQQIKLDVSERDMELKENLLCENISDERDGNEFVNDLIDTSETASDPPIIGTNNNEENCKGFNEENKLTKSGSTNENPQDCNQDQCIKELKEYKSCMVNTYDMTIESNGDCNGETNTVLDSNVFDAYVSNSIKVLDETSVAIEEKNSVVSEVEAVFLIAGSTVVDCIHDKGENHHSNKIEDTNENPESSYVMIKRIEDINMLEQCNSDMVTKNQDESSSMQNSASIFANGGYETRDSVTRLSTESNPDNPNIFCQILKSPSFNLNLQFEARPEESDQIPLLYKSANDNLSNKASLNLSNLMHHDEYDHIEMQVEEKIVTMERSYSEMSKSLFIGFLKEEEEEAHLLVMAQTQDNNIGSNMEVKEVSSASPKGRVKRKNRSYFFTSCMCCATVTN